MSPGPFSPADFAKNPGIAQVDTDLRKWLRSIPVSNRVEFIKQLWPVNFRLALSAVRTSQLPIDTIAALLQHWLELGQHNAAQGLIESLEPVLGKERFWSIARRVELAPAMRDFLNYHSKNQLGST